MSLSRSGVFIAYTLHRESNGAYTLETIFSAIERREAEIVKLLEALREDARSATPKNEIAHTRITALTDAIKIVEGDL